MHINKLLPGDTIGVVAPARPIYNINQEISTGIRKIQACGFNVKKSKFLSAKNYYSAGTAAQRISDLTTMFVDPKIKAILCATGGASANQLLENLDFKLIEKNQKIFMGYSDITGLLLAIYKRSKLLTFYGPNIYEFATLAKPARDFIFKIFAGTAKSYTYPTVGMVIKPGRSQGKLVGGPLSRFNTLMGTPYLPDLSGKILFWEEVNQSPAMIDLELQQLRLAGVFDKISGMIVGHLADCIDKKYPQDNKSIVKIIIDITKSYNFPILKVDYFGHETDNFHCLPIGGQATLDAGKRLLIVSL